MKLRSLTLGLATAAAIFTAGCSTNTVSEESLGLRKTDLYTEAANTTGDKTMYGTKAAGTSKMITRAFENAPPMIPHDVEGMLPITIDSNSCTGCHLPAVASSVEATAIPKSHFTNFRPSTAIAANGKITKEGQEVDNTSDFLTMGTSLKDLNGARFNCTQCHAPQSTGKLVVENTFEGGFRRSAAKGSSNLVNNINEGVK
mgnify:CR=1 FL=1